VVSGKTVYPSIKTSIAGGGGGSSIVGIWEASGQRWQFNSDGSFVLQTSDEKVSGRYATEGSQLTLQVEGESGTERVTYEYSLSGSGSDRQLTLRGSEGSVTLAYAGGGGGGPENVVEAIKLVKFTPEEGAAATAEEQSLQSVSMGSGFIVSPDGYIVTNAHVVLTNKNPKRMLFNRLAGTVRQAVITQIQKRYNIPDEDKKQIIQILTGKLTNYFAEYGKIQGISTDYNVLNGVAGPGEDVKVKSWPAKIEKEGTVFETVNGKPSWSRDVAILSVNQSNLPTVQLGDSTDLGTGDKLFVIGYPGIQVESYFDNRNTALEPTLTTGVVSARRTLNTGINSIQTDAAINSGNSGGPMFDENGQVVGIATFAPTDVDIEQVQFGLPIETAKDFLSQLNVENEQGELDEAYEAALDAYWRGDCETTKEKMETVTNLYPDHPYANEYVRNCETGDAPGQEDDG